MGKGLKHLHLINKHRHRVIANGFHCGIFFHCLFHDLSKYSHPEFSQSKRFYVGDHSPVFEQRLRNGYFSTICQHHTKRNKHHWEYWTDFFYGNLVVMTMPWVYATEYVCDVISASKTYNESSFRLETPLLYFRKHVGKYYMTTATKEYVLWALSRYAEMGFKGLKKKDTKKKYEEIVSTHPKVELISSLHPEEGLPSLVEGIK